MNKERLLNAARALRDADADNKELNNSSMFDMEYFFHSCETPACVLGHYAMRKDLQGEFFAPQDVPDVLGRNNRGLYCLEDGYYRTLDVGSYRIQVHFGITESEAEALFGASGCDHARSEIQAAEFIEMCVDNDHIETPREDY